METLKQEGHDPVTFVFDKDDIVKTLTRLEERMSEKMTKKFRSLEEKISSLKVELAENSRSLEKKIIEKVTENSQILNH